jgi:tetratricopeptide (TPR) repeat protein
MSRLVVFCSHELANREPNVEGRLAIVVAPPVDVDLYRVETTGEYLTLISSDDHVKGVDRFLAFASELPNHKFLLVTDTTYLDVPHNVIVQKRASDVKAVYGTTKLLLLPSRNDSAPRVIIEGALSGIPTLASDLPGVRECSFGLSRTVADPSMWVEAIQEALHDFTHLQADARELAKRRLAQQAQQLDELWSSLNAVVSQHDALLALVMIVKNEAHGIRATLESVRNAVDWWTIVDTGSDDGTPEIIKETMAETPGELHFAPFVDFSTTRNLALELAEPKARFQLMLSGDETVEGAVELRRFCSDHAEKHGLAHEAYDVSVRFGAGTIYRSPRLTRAGAGWRYEGVTHEALHKPGTPPPSIQLPNVHIDHTRHGTDQQRRWLTDLQLLQEATRRDPTETRTAFYLAQTFDCLGMYEPALAAYRRRVELGGWTEEVYEAKVRVASTLAKLDRPWPEVQQAYLDAHTHSAHRAEPLVAIAEYWYRQGNHALSFLFAQRATQIPYPQQCRLFVDDATYEYKAHDLVAIAAYYLGHYDTGRRAAEQALARRPDDARLRENLRHYQARDSRDDPTAFYKQVNEVTDYGSRVELFRRWVEGRKVLHVGCADFPVFDPANNLHIQVASAAREIVGLDVSVEGIAQLRTHLPGRYYTDLDDVADESFDLVLMPETIEHIGDPASALSTMLTRLRCAEFVVTVPNYSYWTRFAHYKDGLFHEVIHPDHYAWYSPSTLRRLLRQVLAPLDRVELFFVNSQSMVGARIQRAI